MANFMVGSRDRAQDNYLRNGRGDPGQWFQHKADYRPPPGEPRLRPEAKGNAAKNQPQIASTLHEYRAKEEPAAVPVRLRDEAGQRNADKFNHQEEKWFDFHGNAAFRPSSRPPHAYRQGAEILELNNQQRSHTWFDHTKPELEPRRLDPRCTSAVGKSIALADRSSRDLLRHEAPAQRPVSPARVKPEGREFLERNQRGTGGGVAAPAQPDQVPAPRCANAPARDNLENSRGASMRTCFDYRGAAPDPQPNYRLHGDVATAANTANRGSLGGLVPGGRAPSNGAATEPAPAPRVRPEAQESYTRGQGSLGNYLDQSKNRSYNSPRPVPRNGNAACAENARRNKGLMDGCLSNTEYRAPTHARAIHPRGGGTGAAQENAAASRGASTKVLLQNSKLETACAPPPPAAPTGITGVLDRTGSAAYHAMAPAARVLGGAANENLERNRGKGIFDVIQQKPPSMR